MFLSVKFLISPIPQFWKEFKKLSPKVEPIFFRLFFARKKIFNPIWEQTLTARQQVFQFWAVLERIRPRVDKFNFRSFFMQFYFRFWAVYYTYCIFSLKLSKIFCKRKTFESAYFTRVSRVFNNETGDANRTRDPPPPYQHTNHCSKLVPKPQNHP